MPPPQSALDFLEFVHASPSPYHAVASVVQKLQGAGFSIIREQDDWNQKLQPGGKYYLIRNLSSVIAFAIGLRWKPGNAIAMIGAHTDSPCLRVKPNSKSNADGFLQVGVETYGGGKWHTWFDRDLSVAGYAIVKEDEVFSQRLVSIDKPILRIPTLAIHLNRSPTFEPNLEEELVPIAGLVSSELHRSSSTRSDGRADSDTASPEAEFEPLGKLSDRHHPYIIELLAQNLGVKPEDIANFEMCLYDTQKPNIGGLYEELIFSPRLDNLNSTYCAAMGLIDSLSSTKMDYETGIRLISCFDHEECGSKSAHGAGSTLLPDVIKRLSILPGTTSSASRTCGNVNEAHDSTTLHHQTLRSSFLVSADMAHSVHPNYTAKHEPNHRPKVNGGVSVKVNSNQRYTTTSVGVVLLQEMAKLARVPLQIFICRNDVACGSTIGPMLSAALGVRTIDVGNPQLSMHSIRETGGVYDIEHCIRLFSTFFSNYSRMVARFPSS